MPVLFLGRGGLSRGPAAQRDVRGAVGSSEGLELGGTAALAGARAELQGRQPGRGSRFCDAVWYECGLLQTNMGLVWAVRPA
jgi:hypothetical protein